MRVALVTGAAGGLGLCTAKRFAQDGMRVALADLDNGRAANAVSELPGDGHISVAINVADEASVGRAFTSVESEIGPIAVLANFAGVIRSTESELSVENLTLTEWNDVFAVNATGAFLCVREMARARSVTPVKDGRIILIASAGAQLGGYQGSLAYFASKGSIFSLAKAAARELAASGITVNVISPGAIDTPMLRAATAARSGDPKTYSAMDRIPAGRVGWPEEIAAAAAYLASPDAAYVTGATLDVNGGLRMQ